MRRRTFPADRAVPGMVQTPKPGARLSTFAVQIVRRAAGQPGKAHLDGNNAHPRRRIVRQNRSVSWQGVIRVAEPGDWQILRDIRLTALSETPTAFGSTYERESAFDADRWRDRIRSSTVLLAFDADPSRGNRNGDALPAPGRTRDRRDHRMFRPERLAGQRSCRCPDRCRGRSGVRCHPVGAVGQQ